MSQHGVSARYLPFNPEAWPLQELGKGVRFNVSSLASWPALHLPATGARSP